ncbi:alanine--tRNA ligase-related protein [Epilithonimonas arachidiradicis]|uniref:Alanyl-tRNA editing protein n=1 Tax=Epilithonimonas arachidiradicis TaxID=1617282 RepID=A0A420D964_9FLAO|nr:alanyl-tRNA editing protein [Epilithonimonas arachidiradicis]RKE87245.1 Ser-tRNA(Ala) deacylase AlaX [Epilithonimonas arachidiradicis]GGG59429.1 alanyl-tRNA editing protein [Epilithonimonas arachidiradicis]
MTARKIFWEDPYQTELTTSVAGISGNVVTLKETIAYAFSGGQQSDDGTINGFKIVKAQKSDKEIFYTIEERHNLKPGDIVEVKIDWDKRYKIMKLHFAAELVLELVNQHFDSPQKIGANITSEKSRIDFIWPNNISGMFPVLEQKLEEIILADKVIISAFSDEAEERRYWKIEGFGQVACGGTHIKKTGELGSLKLKRSGQGKNKERIEIYLA